MLLSARNADGTSPVRGCRLLLELPRSLLLAIGTDDGLCDMDEVSGSLVNF